jgi:hypothetical protein
LSVPPPSISAVSDADVRSDTEAGVPADVDACADGPEDGDTDEPGEAAGGEDDADAEGDAEADGDALGCEELAAPEADPATRWPGAICAEPVVTSVREPTEGGASAGTGAGWPLMPPAAALARVADADT